jgi:YesN/AraC family two-component response regulator
LLLISISRYFHHEDQVLKPSNSLIDNFLYEFERDYQSSIKIKEYAAKKNISCSWFINEFRRYTQCSPKQYITTLRILHAKELLRDLSLTVNEISSLVGYNDPFHFSKIFKKYEGISPSEYRTKHETL